MNKEEFYNKFTGFYKKTGQGIPVIFFKNMNSFIDELVKEGKIKIIDKAYSYSDQEIICLTNVYCVEEECEKTKNILPLIYLRNYLNITDSTEIYNQKIDSENHKELYEKYLVWKEENKIILEKSFDIT